MREKLNKKNLNVSHLNKQINVSMYNWAKVLKKVKSKKIFSFAYFY